jgi:prepilin-type processing-associated H-X9-DG protein
METNLPGYILGSLEPDERRRVEQQLKTDPTAREQLQRLRQALAPLADDSDDAAPPPGLVHRTLARIENLEQQRLPAAPAVSAAQRGGGRRSWRRADVLVAACLLICLGALIPPAIANLQRRAQKVACGDNMRKVGISLESYCDQHDPPGCFPNPARERQPWNVAGFAVPLLFEAGVADDLNLRCPGSSIPPPRLVAAGELRNLTEDEFNNCAPYLLGSYAYSLGYRSSDEIVTAELDDGPLPILADRPPGDPAGLDYYLNSPNHEGAGQNVLFTDGHVEFFTSRRYMGDDLYLNDDGQQQPGNGRRDTVLAPSATRLPRK